jgi:hypothetical protein
VNSKMNLAAANKLEFDMLYDEDEHIFVFDGTLWSQVDFASRQFDMASEALWDDS